MKKVKAIGLSLGSLLSTTTILSTTISCGIPTVDQLNYESFGAQNDLEKIATIFNSTKTETELPEVTKDWEANRVLSDQDWADLGLAVPNYQLSNKNAKLKFIYLDQSENNIKNKESGLIYLSAVIEAYGKKHSLNVGDFDDNNQIIQHPQYYVVYPSINEVPTLEFSQPEKLDDLLRDFTIDPENNHAASVTAGIGYFWRNSVDFNWNAIYWDSMKFTSLMKSTHQSKIEPNYSIEVKQKIDGEFQKVHLSWDNKQTIELNKINTYQITYQNYYNNNQKSEPIVLTLTLDATLPEASFVENASFEGEKLEIENHSNTVGKLKVYANSTFTSEDIKKLINTNSKNQIIIYRRLSELTPWKDDQDFTWGDIYNIQIDVLNELGNSTSLWINLIIK